MQTAEIDLYEAQRSRFALKYNYEKEKYYIQKLEREKDLEPIVMGPSAAEMEEDRENCALLMEQFNIKESDIKEEPDGWECENSEVYYKKDAEFWHLVYDKANYWITKGFDKEVSHS